VCPKAVKLNSTMLSLSSLNKLLVLLLLFGLTMALATITSESEKHMDF
jgi:hypothetical protein